MKILLVVHQFFPHHATGTQVLTLELARGLTRRGHHVDILTGESDSGESATIPPWLTETLYDGFTVHRLHYSNEHSPNPIGLHSSAPDRVELARTVVSRTRPEIVHVHHALGLSSSLIPAVRMLRTPVVYTATDYWAVCPQYTLLHSFDGKLCTGPGGGLDCIRCCVRRFARRPQYVARIAQCVARLRIANSRWTLRQVDAVTRRAQTVATHVNAASMIISATKFLAEALIRNGIDARLMRIIPYGIDIGAVGQKPEVPRCFTRAAPLRLAFMGTLSEHKGPHVILEALTALGERAREVSLHIYGAQRPGNAYYEELCAQVGRLGGIAEIKGTFPHDRIGEVMATHHLLIVPSLWYESTPLVLCAALGAGIPALVSRLGGLTEIVEEDSNGFSFAAGDATALKDVLLRLLDRPQIVADLQRTTLARCRSTADYAADIEAAYVEVKGGQ